MTIANATTATLSAIRDTGCLVESELPRQALIAGAPADRGAVRLHRLCRDRRGRPRQACGDSDGRKAHDDRRLAVFAALLSRSACASVAGPSTSSAPRMITLSTLP